MSAQRESIGTFGKMNYPQPSFTGLPLVGDQGSLDLLPEIVISVDQGKSGFTAFSEQVFDFGKGQQQEQSLDRLAVEGLRPGGKLVLDVPVLLVGVELPVLNGQLPLDLVEPPFDQVPRVAGAAIVDADLEQSTCEEAGLKRAGLGRGKEPLLALDSEDSELGLVAGQSDLNVEGVALGPLDQLAGGIAPLQTEGRCEHSLPAGHGTDAEPREEKKFRHGGMLPFLRRGNKRKRRARGSVLLEATYAMTFLSGLALILMKLSINVTAPRQWTLQQTVSDAYMTYEKAWAQRLSFDDLLAEDSPWPAYPEKSEVEVELGKLPGGKPILGMVKRTRIADANNFPVDGGSGTTSTNPAGMKVWKFQSLLIYTVGDRKYVKTRTVVRSQ